MEGPCVELVIDNLKYHKKKGDDLTRLFKYEHICTYGLDKNISLRTLVYCPFNKSHVMKFSKYFQHTIICPEQFNRLDLKECPYRAKEFIHIDDFEDHINYHCFNRPGLDKFIDHSINQENINTKKTNMNLGQDSKCSSDRRINNLNNSLEDTNSQDESSPHECDSDNTDHQYRNTESIKQSSVAHKKYGKLNFEVDEFIHGMNNSENVKYSRTQMRAKPAPHVNDSDVDISECEFRNIKQYSGQQKKDSQLYRHKISKTTNISKHNEFNSDIESINNDEPVNPRTCYTRYIKGVPHVNELYSNRQFIDHSGFDKFASNMASKGNILNNRKINMNLDRNPKHNINGALLDTDSEDDPNQHDCDSDSDDYQYRNTDSIKHSSKAHEKYVSIPKTYRTKYSKCLPISEQYIESNIEENESIIIMDKKDDLEYSKTHHTRKDAPYVNDLDFDINECEFRNIKQYSGQQKKDSQLHRHKISKTTNISKHNEFNSDIESINNDEPVNSRACYTKYIKGVPHVNELYSNRQFIDHSGFDKFAPNMASKGNILNIRKRNMNLDRNPKHNINGALLDTDSEDDPNQHDCDSDSDDNQYRNTDSIKHSSKAHEKYVSIPKTYRTKYSRCLPISEQYIESNIEANESIIIMDKKDDLEYSKTHHTRKDAPYVNDLDFDINECEFRNIKQYSGQQKKDSQLHRHKISKTTNISKHNEFNSDIESINNDEPVNSRACYTRYIKGVPHSNRQFSDHSGFDKFAPDMANKGKILNIKKRNMNLDKNPKHNINDALLDTDSEDGPNQHDCDSDSDDYQYRNIDSIKHSSEAHEKYVSIPKTYRTKCSRRLPTSEQYIESNIEENESIIIMDKNDNLKYLKTHPSVKAAPCINDSDLDVNEYEFRNMKQYSGQQKKDLQFCRHNIRRSTNVSKSKFR